MTPRKNKGKEKKGKSKEKLRIEGKPEAEEKSKSVSGMGENENEKEEQIPEASKSKGDSPTNPKSPKKRSHVTMAGELAKLAVRPAKEFKHINTNEYMNLMERIKEAWEGDTSLFNIDLNTKAAVHLSESMISPNELSERFRSGVDSFVFFNSLACDKLWNVFQIISETLKKGKRLCLNVRGPSGFGKSFALLSLMLYMRQHISQYRVAYFNYAQDMEMEPDYVINEILMAFYLDRKDIPFTAENVPPSRQLEEQADGLAKWYKLMHGEPFWDSGTKKINPRYIELFTCLKDYCNTKKLKFTIIVDQENTLFRNPGSNVDLCKAIRGLTCDTTLVSASNNNEGFTTFNSWKTITITDGFSVEQADEFVMAKLRSILNIGPEEDIKMTEENKEKIREIKALTGIKPGELYALLYPQGEAATEVLLNTRLTTGEARVWKEIDECIKQYKVYRPANITRQHNRFVESIMSAESKRILNLTYAFVDSELPIEGISYELDNALMYVKNGKIYSLCPLVRDIFKERCYTDKEVADTIVEKCNALSKSVSGSAKGGLLELMLKYKFISFINKSQRDQNLNIQFTGEYMKKSGDRSIFEFAYHIDKFTKMKWRKGEASMEYYKHLFADEDDNNVMFIPDDPNFPGIDLLFYIGKSADKRLYGINITTNILDHDNKKARKSHKIFLEPDGDEPRITTAFRRLNPLADKPPQSIHFIWLGGKKTDESSIREKIIAGDERCKYVLVERNITFAGFDMNDKPSHQQISCN
eukprot:TRINITY_DN120320_c0_g1_i1.p1 TRINITY_DN120320_c0_g1~~TRINITY_DN120320_c0_g1_i1.p1  ORF type:complete len:758 (+),score=62.92 TRINITY_DN120320_c0_g1_i1:284-2557(+)